MDALNVFISSTWIDMQAERSAVESATRRLRSIRFVGMEYFGARDPSTRQVSLDEVDTCHIYVAVVGDRWGSGITAAEYRRAIARGLPCLIYEKADGAVRMHQSAEDAAKLAAWRSELHAHHTVATFESPQELGTRVVADLHNLVFDQLVVQGIGRLHTDYNARIQRFLAEYVGSADAPVPFGGRDHELRELDRWLGDAAAPPYLMLAGPAGRGKSALIVHWARQLAQQQPDLALVYFPISIRFRTNLAAVAFASLTARLTALHDEPLLAGPDTPAEVWRELMAAALRRPLPEGRRMLVLLDGADESADWQPGPDLFPTIPPAGLRVLVSARYLAGDVDARGWMGRLGWERPRAARAIDLAPLTPQGLVDVLRQTSLPLDLLSERADIVAELFRLSAGDPLLVHLYVADLWAKGDEVARLQPEDLQALSPGLEGYFGRWWDDQRALWGDQSPLREPAVNAVLNTLACALGPLRTSELIELLPDGEAFALWALDEVIQRLRRFIVGDGDTQGYAFSHPRLGDYFYDRLAKAGRARQQEMRFVEWGRLCLQELAGEQRATADVPSYLLSYLRAHFERAGCEAKEYVGLAGNAWATAWDRVDKGSFAGYLGDLRRVREVVAHDNDLHAARGETMPLLATELRCALAANSVATQASEMSPALLATLVGRGIWSPVQGIAYITRMRARRARLACLVALVTATRDAERPLALAAGATELRGLLADENELTDLTELLHTAIAGKEGALEPTLLAARVEAVIHLSRQGLDESQQRLLMAALGLALHNTRGPVESLAAAWGRMARMPSTLAPGAETRSGELMRALGIPALSGDTTERGMAALRLALLRTTGPSERDRSLPAALIAAADGVTATVVCGTALTAAARAALTATWQWLPQDQMRDSMGGIASSLTTDQCLASLTEIEQWSDRQRSLDAMALLVEHGPGPERRRVAERLLESAEWASMSGPGAMERMASAVAVLDEATVRERWDSLVSSRSAHDAVILCGAVLRRRGADELQEMFVDHALAAVTQLTTPADLSDVMGIFLDALLPQGMGDGFEIWQARAPQSPLRLALRQVLVLGEVPRSAIHELALRVAPLGPRAAAAAFVVAPLPAALEGPPRPGVAGMVDAAEGDFLAEAAFELSKQSSLADSLNTLNDCVGIISGRKAREAVSLILQRHAENAFEGLATSDLFAAPGLVASARLWPPVAGTLAALEPLARALWSRDDADPGIRSSLLLEEAMPAAVRQPLLAFALGPSPARTIEHEELLPLAAAHLSEPSEEVAALALNALREKSAFTPERFAQALEAWVSLVQRNTLPRWLDVAASAGDADIERWLARMRVGGLLDDSGSVNALMDGVSRIPSSQTRAEWLIRLSAMNSISLRRDAVPIANALADVHHRLDALCAVLQALPQDQRREGLIDALRLVSSVDDRPQAAVTLVQMAVDLDPNALGLLDEATAAAIAIRDSDLRGRALACVTSVLPAERAASAATASRRIGDIAQRFRAMRALAEVCVDRREEAASRIRVALEALPKGPERSAAIVFSAPLLPPNLRWAALDEAIPSLANRPAAFDVTELLDSLTAALPDAPARLFVAALGWTRRVGALRARSVALARLLPLLPASCRVAAWVQISEALDGELISRLHSHFTADEIDASAAFAPASRMPAFITDHPALPLEDVPLDRLERALAEAANDVDRAAAVQRFALSRHAWAGRAALVATTRAIGDGPLRVAAIRCLAVLAAEGPSARVLALTAAIEGDAVRALASVRLGVRLKGQSRERLFDEALASALAESDVVRRITAAVECAVAAPSLLRPVLHAIGQLSESVLRIRALQALWRDLPDAAAAQALPEALALLDDDLQVRWLAEIGAFSGTLTAAAVLSHLATLSRSASRARVVCALLPRLGDDHRAAAMAVIDAIAVDYPYLAALAAASARWPEEFTTERARRAVPLLTTAGDEAFSAHWLKETVALWPLPALPDLVHALNSISTESRRHDLLCDALRHHVGDGGLLAIARAELSTPLRAVALGVAASLSSPPDERLFDEALDAARAAHPLERIRTLVRVGLMAGRVAPPVFSALEDGWARWPRPTLQAFRDVGRILDADQAKALIGTMPWHRLVSLHHECADLLRALDSLIVTRQSTALMAAAAAIGDPAVIAELLCEWAPWIDDDVSQHASLSLALSLRSDTARARALIAIVGRLSTPLQQRVLAALAAVPRKSEQWRRLALVRPCLTPEALRTWVELAGDPPQSGFQIDPSSPLANSGEAVEAVDEVASARAVDEALDQLLTEVPIADRPPPRRPASAVKKARSELAALLGRLRRMSSEDDRASALGQSLPCLSSADRRSLIEVLPELLGAARHDRLLPRLAVGLVGKDTDVLAAALGRVSSDRSRFATLLGSLKPLLGPSLREGLAKSMREVCSGATTENRSELLAWIQTMAPLMPLLGGEQAAIQTLEAIDEAGRMWP